MRPVPVSWLCRADRLLHLGRGAAGNPEALARARVAHGTGGKENCTYVPGHFDPAPCTTAGRSGINRPPTLTVTFYRTLAGHFSEAIDEISDAIPTMAAAAPKAFIRSHLNVPLKFLATAISAVEDVDELRVLKKLDVERAYDTLQLIEAFRPIRAKILGFLADLDHALNSRQAQLTVEALDTYDLAKSLARDPKSGNLSAWVDNMARDLGKRGQRKSPAPPAPPSDADPVPVPVSTITAPEKQGWKG